MLSCRFVSVDSVIGSLPDSSVSRGGQKISLRQDIQPLGTTDAQMTVDKGH
jgi:hypothetical protein